MISYRDEHYGLAGKTVRISRRRGTTEEEEKLRRSLGRDPYPWDGREVPVLITAEYPKYLTGRVLMHKGTQGWPITEEYPISIDKFDIYIGQMKKLFI